MKLKHSKNIIFLGFIFIIAFFIRIYRLDSIPYGFHNDEARAAWNAYSILKTGADDKGNILPMYYDSFGDFRPTGLIYFIIPSLIFFGQTVFAVRFPFALIGSLTIFPLFFIVKEISKNSKLGVLSSLIISLNPWHIIASRSTSESVVSMFLTLWGIYFLIKYLKKAKFKYLFLSIVFFIISYFFYHSIRVLAPVFVLTIIIFDLINKKRSEIDLKPLIVLFVLIIASFLFLSSKSARGRMSQVSLLSDFRVLYEVTKMPNEEIPGHLFEARAFHNRIASYIRIFAEEYKEYFGTSFLLGSMAKPIRYTVPQVGLLTYLEFIFLIFGLFLVSRKKELLLMVFLLALAPLPAAVTIEDTPNLQRSIYMIPFIIIIAAYGLNSLFEMTKKFRAVLIIIFIAYLANFIYFSHMYYIHQRTGIASYYRDGGNVELTSKINEIESNYDKIVLTNSPDNLYPWLAFFNNYDPKIFNQSFYEMKDGIRKYNNIVFSTDKCPLNSALEKGGENIDNVLFVDAEGCVVDKKFNLQYEINLIDTIFRPDGSPPYYLRSVKQLK